MDFDELDEVEQPLDSDLIELLDKYEVPGYFRDFLVQAGYHSCKAFAKIATSKEEATDAMTPIFPDAFFTSQNAAKSVFKVYVRNLWHACYKKAAGGIEAEQAERARQGGILLKLFESDATFVFPAGGDVRGANVKAMLESYLGELPKDFHFYSRDEGGVDKRMDLAAVMPNQVFCYGLDSFERKRHSYEHPFVIVGGGHMGLRCALAFQQEKVHDYLCFDKHDRPGGTAWIVNANAWSKVQSELGTYHLSWSAHNTVPKDMPPWPSREQVLNHFQDICDSEGVTPHLRLKTWCKEFEIIPNKDKPGEQSYKYTVERTDEQGEVKKEKFMGASVNYFPGNLTVPRRAQYKGEDNFEGNIYYGMFGETDYSKVTKNVVAVVGMGAFAIENCRTCVEHHAKKIYILCRTKHLALPRMTSFFVNNSVFPLSGATFVDHMKPMYALFGESPWDYHSVTANSSRTMVTVSQSARTGIGDIYFLARFYGKVEVMQSSIIRLTKSDIVLDVAKDLTMSSRILTASVLIKSLGFEPDQHLDTFLQCTEYTGWWSDGDYRRSCVSDLRSLHASNFGGTGLANGLIGQVYAVMHCLHFPSDFHAFMATGSCPKHRAEPEKGYPAVVTDAKTGSTTGMVVTSMIPWLPMTLNAFNSLKRPKNQQCHPTDYIHRLAEEEWFRYCELFKADGDNRPFPPYPYPLAELKKDMAEQDAAGCAKNGIPYPPGGL